MEDSREPVVTRTHLHISDSSPHTLARLCAFSSPLLPNIFILTTSLRPVGFGVLQ